MSEQALWFANGICAAITVGTVAFAASRARTKTPNKQINVYNRQISQKSESPQIGRLSREPRTQTRMILLCALLLLGAALRIAGFRQTPAGFNQDEASGAYDAWALNEYGIDRNGDANPVYAVAWGSGQNTLYTTLYRLILPLLGNSVSSFRTVSLLLGLLSLWLLYLILRRAAGTAAALAGLGLLAISPWHIMLCRWGLESNILPAFLLIGAYFALRTEDNPWFLAASFAALGASLYAYATAYVVVPPIALYLLYRYVKTRFRGEHGLRRFWLPMVTSLLLLAIAALPLILSVLVNRFGLSAIDLGFLSIPRLTESRYESTMNLHILENLWQFFSTVMLRQNDGLIWNAAPAFGCLYLCTLPFCAVGAVLSWKRRGEADKLFLVWFGACVCLAAFTSVNINRVNAVFLPLVYFAAVGIEACVRRARVLPYLNAAAYLLLGTLFVRAYFTDIHERLEVQFFVGFGDAIQYAETLGETETVYVSSVPNAAYISVLFFTETPPRDFLDTVVWINPNGAFRAPSSFGRYRFGLPSKPGGGVYIAHGSELARFDREDYNIRRFGHYAVAVDKAHSE